MNSSTFASCLIDFFTDKVIGYQVPIIIYSEGCSYQNRNAVLSNALLSFSVHEKITIHQKILEKGYTQMEADSVHAKIKCKLKNQAIHLPYDYVKYTQVARKNPFPYETKYLSFDFVKNFGSHGMIKYETICSGRRPGDPTVNDIREIMYTPDSIIKVQYDFDGTWMDTVKRPNNITHLIIPNFHNCLLNLLEYQKLNGIIFKSLKK